MALSHYLNQWRNIVNWTLRNKLQWNFNWNLNIFIQENAFEHVICEMASILSWPQCFNPLWPNNVILPSGNKQLPKPLMTHTNGILWHSAEIDLVASMPWYLSLKWVWNYISKITATFSRGQWVKPFSYKTCNFMTDSIQSSPGIITSFQISSNEFIKNNHYSYQFILRNTII